MALDVYRRTGAASDPERLRQAVLDWRGNLGASLARMTDIEIDWDESDQAPYFTGQPRWDGLGSLVLWAAYTDVPALRRPASMPEVWDDDPVPLPFTFESEDVGGRRIVMGSTEMLQRQLGELNGATWKARPDEVAAWTRRPPVSQEGTLELLARYAFAVMSELARKAVEHRLPMKLDF